jgi:hypothetical protein
MSQPRDQLMKVLNRAALVVRPKEPYIRWATGLDKDAPHYRSNLREQVEVYLVPEYENDPDGTRAIRQVFSTIFASELDAWHTDPARWPQVRDLATFHEWFAVEFVSMVTDLDEGDLTYEKL